MITTKNLTKKYRSLIAVNNLNLSVEKNSIYGLLGCNGAGKTTTLAMLSTLIRPTSGTATINTHDIIKQPNKVRACIGTLLQNCQPYPNKTMLQNLIYMGQLNNMSKIKAKQQALELIKDLNIQEFTNKKAHTLSHGTAKKLLLISAFIGDPEIIMLDEPESGLDPRSLVIMRNFIENHSKNKTIILSSHNTSEVERICTHIGILHNGRLIKQGKINELKHLSHYLKIKLTKKPATTVIKALQTKNVLDISLEDTTLIIKTKSDISKELTTTMLKKKLQFTSIEKGRSLEDIFLSSLKE